MKFGNLAVEECAGAILAHGLRVADGVLKKGRVLAAEDVEMLRDAGYAQVMVARLEADDVGEDQAAAALAAALAGDGVSVGQPFTGRCNVFARHGGLLLADADRLDTMNRVDEAMTVATLKPFPSLRSPTTSLKSKRSPGRTTIPSIFSAATARLKERSSERKLAS